jgi:molybdate/tungstate transport system substrate-binding protein
LAADGITIDGEAASSLAAAQRIADGAPTDLYATADANTNQVLMGAANGEKVRWFATFASNAVVIAYSPTSPLLAEFAKAKAGASPWYSPLTEAGVRLARTDPDSDPLGYYSVIVSQLAEQNSGQQGLKKKILGDDRNPDQIKAGDSTPLLKSGALDAALMYRTGALAGGLPFIELPENVNLSSEKHAADYAKASFTNNAGITFVGGVIAYSIAPIEGSAHANEALKVLAYLLSPAGQKLCTSLGFLPIPVLVGGDRSAVPPSLERYVEGTYRAPAAGMGAGTQSATGSSTPSATPSNR